MVGIVDVGVVVVRQPWHKYEKFVVFILVPKGEFNRPFPRLHHIVLRSRLCNN